jgi:hypothetical protein
MATLNLDEILNYINPEPRYAGKLEDLGLLGEGDLKAARKQSIFQGLLGAGLGYLAQPKNQGYGSIAPYLAKAGMQGLQASKAPYEQLTQDALMNQKLKEVEYQRGERKYQDDQRVLAAEKLAIENEISKMPLFKTTLTNRPNLPIGPKQLTLPSGEQSVRPMFGTTPQSPTVSQEINIDKLNRLAGNQSYNALTANLGLAESINKLQNPERTSTTIDGKHLILDENKNILSVKQIADPKIKDPQSPSFQNVYNEVTKKTQKYQVPRGALGADENGDGIPDNWKPVGDPYSSTDTRDIGSASMTNIRAVVGRIENKFNIANDIASVAEEIGRINQLKGTPINDAAKTNQAIELFKKSGALIEGSFMGNNESYDSNKFTSYVNGQLTGETKESTGITTLPNGNVSIRGKGDRDGEYQILPNGTYKKVRN